MNIKELKASIQDLPDDMPVAYYDNEYGEYWEASVEVKTITLLRPGVWEESDYHKTKPKQTILAIL